jgi:hypothetical protein
MPTIAIQTFKVLVLVPSAEKFIVIKKMPIAPTTTKAGKRTPESTNKSSSKKLEHIEEQDVSILGILVLTGLIFLFFRA